MSQWYNVARYVLTIDLAIGGSDKNVLIWDLLSNFERDLAYIVVFVEILQV